MQEPEDSSSKRRSIGRDGTPLGLGFGSVDELVAETAFLRAELARAREDAERAQLLADAAAMEIIRLRKAATVEDRSEALVLGVAAHEIKGPLTALKLSLHRHTTRLRANAPGFDDAAVLSRMDQQVKRLATLVDGLLGVAASHEVDGAPTVDVDLTAIARDVLERMTDALAYEGCTVDAKLDAPVVGRWQRVRVEQVITNLVANAMKFGRGAPIEVVVCLDGKAARIEVADRGRGIAAEDHERIFERFDRGSLPRNFAGTGLGLWIVRSIVKDLGGHIHVASAVGAGARLVVVLPRDPSIDDVR